MPPPFQGFPIERFFIGEFGTELIYSFVIVLCSLMVYFGTKELYELSKYKGIKYFRQSFLFFAFAYFFRSIIKFLLMFFNINLIFDFSPRIIGPITILIFMYFSSMAVFYLLYSVMWKRWNNSSKKVYLFNALAIVISLISVSSREPAILFGVNLFLFLLVTFIVSIAYKESKDKKKHNNLYAIYLLLFIFYILNIIDVLIPKFLQTTQLLIYLASIGIFLMILYKVLKKSGPS